MNRVTSYLIALVLSILVAALFAALWYGAYTENTYLQKALDETRAENQQLKTEVKSLSDQLNAKSRELSDTLLKLQEAQKQLEEKTQQLTEVQSQLDKARQDLATTRAELDRARAELANAKSQIADLTTRVSLLRAELERLNATYQRLSQMVYGGKNMVDTANNLLSRIQLTAPNVGDTWNFEIIYRFEQLTLQSGYFTRWELEFTIYDNVEIETTESIWLAVFTPSEFEKWRNGYDAKSLTEGRGYLRFTPLANGTYIIVLYNNLGRDVIFDLTYRRWVTWTYYDIVPPNPRRPYVVGSPLIPAREIFKMFAIYNYWYNHRHELAEAIRGQLQRGYAFSAGDLNLTRDVLYALSLAALLKSAGLEVSFAAISTSWKEPLRPASIVPVVKFTSPISTPLLNNTYNIMYEVIEPIGWIHTMWWHSRDVWGQVLYVLLDTYNVIERVDYGRKTTVPFNVIYVPEVTRLE